MCRLVSRLVYLVTLVTAVAAFAPAKTMPGRPRSALAMDRREAAATLLGGAALLGNIHIAQAVTGNVKFGTREAPIVVLGASGKVGKMCCEILAQQGLYTVASTRSGRTVVDSPYVSSVTCDVSKIDAVLDATKGASGVIFAASASGKKKGGDPAHVDYLGAYNTAQACLANNVPKLALISSATATRPSSLGFKATNFAIKYVYGDKMMDYKIAGETAVRDQYAAAGKSNLAYAVIRPGGLSDGPSIGSTKLHVSQGDVYAGEISRTDVAKVTVAALLSTAADNTTFELNSIEGLVKAEKNLPDLPAELVHAGASSTDGLLAGLKTDAEMSKYDFVSDFKGDGIEDASSLV